MKALIIAASVGLLLSACGDDKAAGDVIELKTQKDKLSYAVGADHAKQLVQDRSFADYNKEKIIEGFDVGLHNEAAFDVGCQQTLQQMFQGRSVDPKYLEEGSLAIGKLMGSNFLKGWKQDNFIQRFNLDMVKTGFVCALNGTDTLIQLSERQKLVSGIIGELNEKVMAQSMRKETAFFTNVKLIPGVKEIGNGIYVETLKEGKGGSPAVGDDVESRYVLISPKGDTLESSLAAEKAGQPIPAFSLNRVIQGWAIAFPHLKKGGKYRLYVPQGLAYGANPPQGSPIEPFSPLIFYVELVNFGKPGTLVKPQPGMAGM